MMSLKTKISVFVTLIIVVFSVISTALFTSAHSRSKGEGRIIRGTVLNRALAKAAEEGLILEDLSLIKKASHIVLASDVTLVQVYSSLWDALDAYPLAQLREPPHPDAVAHFKGSREILIIPSREGYDFYSPILLKVSGDSSPLIIGFSRIVLSSASIKKELMDIIVTNIIVSAIITLLAIISINILISRLVIRPVMRLHSAASLFKEGGHPDAAPVSSADEIGDLARMFNAMIEKRRQADAEREQLIHELQAAMKKVKTLSGMLPLCASCKKVRDDKGYWNQIDAYISEHSDAEVSHGLCPECAKKLYPDQWEKMQKANKNDAQKRDG